MKKVRFMLLCAFKKYGILGAKMPSYHGSYEAQIPVCLQKKLK